MIRRVTFMDGPVDCPVQTVFVPATDYDALYERLLTANRWKPYAWHLTDCPNNDGVSACLCGFSDLIPLPEFDSSEPEEEPENPQEAWLTDDQRYHRLMGWLRATKLKHGLCHPRSRRACTHCNAVDDIAAELSAYKGPPLVLAGGGSGRLIPELGSAHEQVDCPDPATCVLCTTQRDL